MQDSTKNMGVGGRFDILLFPQFSNHCLANFVEPLRAANTLSGSVHYHWRFLTLDGAPVESSSGLRVDPHAALADGGADCLVVMPSYGFREFDRSGVPGRLRRAASRYLALIGMDTGSWLLARAGLLDGKRATIHWEELTEFAETFPEVDALRERYVIDGNRITCSGAMAAFDLCQHVIAAQHGPWLSAEVAQLFMSRGQTRAEDQPMRTGYQGVDRALALMQENLETPLPIGAIARALGVTQKTLETRMRARLQATPQQIYKRLRLNLARKLVRETGLSVSEVALRCGYENASAMTRAYKQAFGETPRAMRTAAV